MLPPGFEVPPGFEAALAESWAFFLHLAVVLIPLFVLGSLLVALVEEYLPPERVERVLRRYDGGSGNVVAAGFGAITPFCSCSTVPMLAGLLQAGAPVGLAFSFLLASPLVNELAVLLLAGLFGVEVAALYVTVTLLSAIVLGIVLGKFGLETHLKDVDLFAADGQAVATDGGQPTAAGATSSDDCGCGTGCGDGPAVTSRVSRRDRIRRALAGIGTSAWDLAPERLRRAVAGIGSLYRDRVPVKVRRAVAGTGSFFRDLVPYLLLGMTVGAAIHGFVPTNLLTRFLGPSNPVAVPLAAVGGAPIYVSMSAMLPVAASFADQGIPIGTVLAFVVGSAGVSIPNLVLLNKLFDRTLLAVYALTVVSIGIVLGLLFNALPL